MFRVQALARRLNECINTESPWDRRASYESSMSWEGRGSASFDGLVCLRLGAHNKDDYSRSGNDSSRDALNPEVWASTLEYSTSTCLLLQSTRKTPFIRVPNDPSERILHDQARTATIVSRHIYLAKVNLIGERAETR
jgi:hypothetical protein